MYSYNDQLVKEIESRIDIVDIIGESVDLTRKGNRYWGLCPFHSEKTPSFSVSQEKQLFYCFGCREGGNVFTFLQKHKNLEFKEALEYLAQKAGIDTNRFSSARSSRRADKTRALIKVNQAAADFYHQNLVGGQGGKVMAYLEQRGISSWSIKKFHLGYALDGWDSLLQYLLKQGYSVETILEAGLIRRSQKGDSYIDTFRNRLIFPILNQTGQLIGFGGRLLEGEGPKYLNSQETQIFSKRNNLFGIYQARQAIRNTNEIILVEGYMDCIQLHQSGVANVVATLGTALTNHQAKLMKRMAEKLVVLYDGDESGRREALRAASILQEEGLDTYIVVLPEGKDPDDYIRKHRKEEFLKFIQNNRLTVLEYRLASVKRSFVESSWNEKKRILETLFADVAHSESILMRDNQLGIIARRLDLPEGDVIKEFRHWQRNKTLVGSIRNRNSGNRNNRKRLENQEIFHFQARFVAKIINEPELLDKVKQQIGFNFLMSDDMKELVMMFDRMRGQAEPEAAKDYFLEAVYRDEELQRLWAEITLIAEEQPLSPVEFNDFISAQRVKWERLRWEQFWQDVKRLEEEGDFFSILKTIVRLGNMTDYQGQEGGRL